MKRPIFLSIMFFFLRFARILWKPYCLIITTTTTTTTIIIIISVVSSSNFDKSIEKNITTHTLFVQRIITH